MERGMSRGGRALMTSFILAMGAHASACELTAGGEARWYSGRETGSVPRDYRTIASLQGELSCARSDGAHSFSAKLFGRWAQHRSTRGHADIREFQWVWTREPFQVRAGIDRVFWGVTEFAHIVDVINQSDVFED